MKIAIITMHRVLNFGSALQAYALQRYIEENISSECFLIDYSYPNKYHIQEEKRRMSAKQRIHTFLGIWHDILVGGRISRKKAFSEFYRDFFRLSCERYDSPSELKENWPKADVYVTGSDQVWNINTMYNDGSFYLDFVSGDAKCISYASSFSGKTVPYSMRGAISDYLGKYTSIGLREASGVNFVKSLQLKHNPEIANNCDPTLLLSAKDYHIVGSKSKIKIEGDYILVYMLLYAFDPRPAITEATRKAAEHYGCKVILIGVNHLDYDGKLIYMNDFGPSEFVWLFENARYVLTSSFHGTMFSVIYRKPFVSIIPSETDDNRTKDFLYKVGLSGNALPVNKSFTETYFANPFDTAVEEKIEMYLRDSKSYLQRNLK